MPLDDSHKYIVDELTHLGYSTIWLPDYYLLQTHTKALEELCEKGIAKGIFKTNSAGKDKGSPNAFMFPLDNGVWRVYRFSPGTVEAETWTQDGSGWTNCYFNKPPDLHTAATAKGGIEAAEQRRLRFSVRYGRQ